MTEPRIGSLFSGYSGLDMGVQAVLGGDVVWHSDIDKGSCKLLAHRFPDVPNLGDVSKIDWLHVTPVDIITAGFPCQPVSHAGKRLGDDDERWLWDEVVRAVRAVRPRLLFLENVRGLLSARSGRLFGRVLGTLADIGFDAEWICVRASEVDATHKRERVFILATDTECGGRDGWTPDALRRQVTRAAALGNLEGALLPTPRATDGTKGLRTPEGARREFARRGNGADLATVLTLLPTPAVNDMGNGKTVDAWDEWTATMKAKHGNGNGHGKSLAIELQRIESGWGPYEPAIRRWEPVVGREAPAPSEAALVREWMMGLPLGWVTDTPGLTRNDMLKLCGNGVVPQQAEAALRLLLAREAVAA